MQSITEITIKGVNKTINGTYAVECQNDYGNGTCITLKGFNHSETDREAWMLTKHEDSYLIYASWATAKSVHNRTLSGKNFELK